MAGGIIDEPVQKLDTLDTYGGFSRDRLLKEIKTGDTLGVSDYAFSLASFIEQSDTPITIGVQGAWGSGKTSLLNTIYSVLAQEKKFEQIWVNAWEHALLTSPEETLLKITVEILEHITAIDQEIGNKDKIIKSARTAFTSALRIGASATLGGKAVDIVDEIIGNADASPVKRLRKNLEELTQQIRERKTNPVEKILVYVDDLDRIEPKDAVKLLELLKNIFSIPNCIFVLAIDYDVVVKGLKDKFGERSPQNEREFRAYFDKIIQLPFMMPVGSYSIGKYVGDLLEKIGFISERDYNEDHLDTIIKYTVRGNPRSVKRLVNSLALISIFIETRESRNNEYNASIADLGITTDMRKVLLFAVVCIQIAFPKIYEFLVDEPDFENSWDEDWAQSHAHTFTSDEQFNADYDRVIQSREFDEVWEQSLFIATYGIPEYRGRIRDVSLVLNFLREEFLSKINNAEAVFSAIIGETSVTSIAVSDFEMGRPSNGRTRFDNRADLLNIKREQGYKEDILESLDQSLEAIATELSSQGFELFWQYTPTTVTLSLMVDSSSGKVKTRVVCYVHPRKSKVLIDLYKGEDNVAPVNGKKRFYERVFEYSKYADLPPNWLDNIVERCKIAIADKKNHDA